MPRRVVDIIGKRFGRLVVLENLQVKSHNSTLHRCICDCGNYISVPKSYLCSKHTTSCGCLRKESHSKHKLCYTRLYNIYCEIKRRCLSPNKTAYKDYGGRGITICNEWFNDFVSFYNWAIQNGYNDNLTIDRIDVNGNYEPKNCRWITKGEQCKNTRKNIFLTYNGKTQILSDWARETGIPQTTLNRRLKQFSDFNIIFYKGNLHKLFNEQAKLLR